ncbi:sushi domain-containing protein 2-like isoform X2 [Dreissena polymorpha]|uniref:sushi domain-containing protein 2-like isoform X2 n=1 Tax=Dreissena polymorpha TaxID=45954 RepID=UPI002263C72D|nr:sushi domain-containing protein 2-like isoform X2 [Dreissena polymorpha]
MALDAAHTFTLWIFIFSLKNDAYEATPMYTLPSVAHNLTGKGHHINTSTPFVYEGKLFSSFVISINGFVAFTHNVTKPDFNNMDWSKSDISPPLDLLFIAPYYHDESQYQSRVEYGQIEDTSLNNFGDYCSAQVIASSNFRPKYGIMVSWIISSTDLTMCGVGSNQCLSNTFQLVLLTDGNESFAIFNYEKMGMAACKNCKAGFKGDDWTDIISRRWGLRELPNKQSSDTVGRYVFKISPGRIVRAGCSTDTYTNKLTTYPTYAGMFGGRMIDVSGPCFNRTETYTCRFGEGPDESKAIYLSPNRVRCMVPRLLFRDNTTLSLQANGQTYTADFYIVFPGRLTREESVGAVRSKEDMGWYASDPSTLTLTWGKNLLSSNPEDRVEVNLIGYKEFDNKASFTLLSRLGSNISALALKYTLDDPKQHQCSGTNCEYELGLLEVKLIGDAKPIKYMYLSSNVILLGWYVRSVNLAKYGTNWAADLCLRWYNKDKKDKSWVGDLLSCPCSLQQAILDFGRFQPDDGCKLQNAHVKGNCFYHDAVHCVRAVQPTGLAGNQCCYSSSGILVHTADSFGGSTPDKAHDWGAAPYIKARYVPLMSHWLDDLVTLHYCCVWTANKSCDYYMDLRPTTDCTGYTPPLPATVYGQGHVMTFGKVSHRMRGPGDYILFRSGNTEIQGRFERNLYRTEGNITISDTVTLVAVAVLDRGTSDRVEIELRGPEYDRRTQQLNVRVNGQYISYDQKSMYWQDYKGVAIVNTDERNKQSNFTVMLTNGIGFQVAEAANTLQMDLLVPRSYKRFSGLFGTLSGEMLLPTDTIIDVNSPNPSEKYNQFQLAWAVTESNSLFQTFLPANDPVILRPTPLAGKDNTSPDYCMGNQDCIFDFRHTGSEAIARSSQKAAERYASLYEALTPVRVCGLLDVPRSIKTNFDYTLGTTTTIASCRVGELKGTKTYECVATTNTTQEWSPTVDAVCEVKSDETATGLIVGITFAVCLMIAAAIAIAIVVIRKRRTKRSGEPHTTEEMVKMKTSE